MAFPRRMLGNVDSKVKTYFLRPRRVVGGPHYLNAPMRNAWQIMDAWIVVRSAIGRFVLRWRIPLVAIRIDRRRIDCLT